MTKSFKPQRIVGAIAFAGLLTYAAQNAMNSHASSDSDQFWREHDARMTRLHERALASRIAYNAARLNTDPNMPPEPTLEAHVQFNDSDPWNITEGPTTTQDNLTHFVEELMDSNPEMFRSEYRRNRAMRVVDLANEIAPEYGIDPAMIVALGYQETHLGNANEAAREANNVFSVYATQQWERRGGDVYVAESGQRFRQYASLRESVEDVCRVLQREYIARDRTEVPEIMYRYSPPSENDTQRIIAAFNSQRDALRDMNATRIASHTVYR